MKPLTSQLGCRRRLLVFVLVLMQLPQIRRVVRPFLRRAELIQARRFVLFVSILLCFGGRSSPCYAFGTSTRVPEGWYVLPGVEFGLTFSRAKTASGLYGAELSFAHLSKNLFWGGAYFDVAYDTGAKEARLSLGPELGFALGGLDFGYLAMLSRKNVSHGFAVRPLLTVLGFGSLFFRSGVLFEPRASWFGELGFQLKWPTQMDGAP